MSDNDFIIIDEEKETPVTTEGKESSDTEKRKSFRLPQKRNTRMSMRRSALSAIVRRA